jgi:hypothetical protein
MSGMIPKKFRLRKLGFDEVSLVPSGDDPMAEVVLSKSDKTPDGVEGGSTVSNHEATAHPKETAVGKQKIEIEVAEDGTISKDDLPEGLKEHIEALESENAELVETIEGLADGTIDADALAAALSEIDADDQITDSVLAKAEPAIRAEFEKIEKRAVEAENIAKAERDARITGEFVEIAKGLPNLPATAQDLGTILKSVADALPEDQAGEVYRILKAADTAMGEGLLVEVGKAGETATVGSRVQAAAEEIRKGDPAMPIEVAIAQAYDNDPSLYDNDQEG